MADDKIETIEDLGAGFQLRLEDTPDYTTQATLVRPNGDEEVIVGGFESGHRIEFFATAGFFTRLGAFAFSFDFDDFFQRGFVFGVDSEFIADLSGQDTG